MMKKSSDSKVHFIRDGRATVNDQFGRHSFDSHADAIAHLKKLGLDYTKMTRFGDPNCYPVRR